MFDHLRYRSTRVETRSPAGELAEQVLMFNDVRSVEYRELVLGVIAALEEKKRRVQETLRRIDQKVVSSPVQAEQLAAERASAARDMAKLEQQLLRVAGAASL